MYNNAYSKMKAAELLMINVVVIVITDKAQKCAFSWDKSKLVISFLTPFHQFYPDAGLLYLCLSLSTVKPLLTQSASSSRSTSPNHLNPLLTGFHLN